MPRPVDEIGNDQEVAGETHLVDDIEFDFEAFVIGFALFRELRRTARVLVAEQEIQPLFQPLLTDLAEVFGFGHAVRNRELRQVVLAQRQRHIAAFGDFHRVGDGGGDVGEQFRHFLRRAQILLRAVMLGAFGVSQHVATVDADAGFVRGKITFGDKTHVVGGDHWQVMGKREFHGGVDVIFLTIAPGALQFKVVAVGKMLLPFLQAFFGKLCVASE